jgi:hypothetical protein
MSNSNAASRDFMAGYRDHLVGTDCYSPLREGGPYSEAHREGWLAAQNDLRWGIPDAEHALSIWLSKR